MKALTLILLLLAVAGWGLVAFGAVRYAETAEERAYLQALTLEQTAANARQDSIYAERRRRDSLKTAYWQVRSDSLEVAASKLEGQLANYRTERRSFTDALVSAETTDDSLVAALAAVDACDAAVSSCETFRTAAVEEARACSDAADALTASVDECERSLVLRDTLVATQAAELELWRSLPPSVPGPVRPFWETATIGAAGVGIGAVLTLILTR